MNSLYWNTLKKILTLFPDSIKKQFWKMQVLIAITSIIDVFGLAAFIPVISAVANPSLLSTSNFFIALKNITNIHDGNYFLLFLFSVALVFFIVRLLFVVYSQYLQNKFTFYVSEYIGEKTYSYYMNLDYQKFNKIDSANVVRELTISSSHFSRFLIMSLFLINSELLMMSLIILGIALYNFNVFLLLSITLFPIAFLFQKAVKKKIVFYGEEQNKLSPILYTNSNRGVFGYVDAKLLNKENSLIQDYLVVLKRLNKINVATSTINIIPAKLFELVTFVGLFLIFLYAVFYSNHVETVIPLIAIYAAAGYRIIPSLSKLVPSFMQLEQFSYLFETYKEPLSSNLGDEKLLFANKIIFKRNISLKNISFKFENDKVFLFSDFNLTISKGETIGIVGKSGSGKTTLVKLISGLLKSTSGNILVDDVKIDETNIRSWMSNISYVQQSPYIEQGSLASNIAFLVDTEIDVEKLQKCIEMASLSDFVNEQNPFEIEIKEGGKNLSGGQKQRICIARALYNNSQLLIFDEATSALDNETEKEVTNAVKQLRGSGVTVVIIAHRYSTLVYTDRIIELEANSFKETTYQEIEKLKF